MASIASKNLYELLGNDPELDPDRPAPPPTKVIDKPVNRSGKRDAGPSAPSETSSRGRGRGSRGDSNATGSDRAYRDRDAGAYQNRSRGADDGIRQDRHPNRGARGGGEYRGRGGRGGRGGRRGSAGNLDRHDKSGIAEHPKQAAHGWGGNTGNDEYADEKAGEAIAKAEEAEGFDTTVPPPQNGDGETWAEDKGNNADGAVEDEAAEAEAKSKSYEEYLAEQAEKKLQLGGGLEVRKANEGASKKFPEGKAFAREEAEYFVGAGGKEKRVREKKEKQTLDMSDVDPRSYLAEDRSAGRGGRGRGDFRGRGEGGRGRGEGGRGRGRGGDRGDRGDRGGDRGGRGGEYRGGRGRGSAAPRVNDDKAFPSLGS